MIDPRIDCVFKGIFGKQENEQLLISLLNAFLFLEGKQRIKKAMILNPFNEREFKKDKLTIVDIRAEDRAGRIFHVEMQINLHPDIVERILYKWACCYKDTLRKGQAFKELKPTRSLWILGESLYPETEEVFLPFEMINRKHNLLLSDHIGIDLVQLDQWERSEAVLKSEREQWLYLLSGARHVKSEVLKQEVTSRKVHKAVSIMEAFAANSQMMRLYEERIRDAEHVRASIRAERQSFEQQVELERRRADEEQRLREESDLRAAEEQRLREESELRAEEQQRRAEEAEMALAELRRQLESKS